jgi:uncharacterized membrane protein YfcA
VLLLAVAWRSWPRHETPAPAVAGPHGALARAAAGAGGVIGGLLGVGGGIVFMPLLHLLAGLEFHRAAATSVYLIGLTAGSGAIVYLVRGDVALPLAAPTMLGVLIGATGASLGARQFSAAWLKRAFAALLVYVAVRMLLRGFGHA